MSTPQEQEFLSVGKRIREARGSIPQKAFAEAVGVSATSLSQLENAQTVPKLDTLIRIARQTDKPLDWFVYENPDGSRKLVGYPRSKRLAPQNVKQALERVKRARLELEMAQEELEAVLSMTMQDQASGRPVRAEDILGEDF